MSRIRCGKPRLGVCRLGNLNLVVVLIFVWVAQGQRAFGQDSAPGSPEDEHSHTATALPELLTEANQNNPQIQAARQAWDAAKQIPSQVPPRPDPLITVKQVPFASPPLPNQAAPPW